jgi:hypothetical protein
MASMTIRPKAKADSAWTAPSVTCRGQCRRIKSPCCRAPGPTLRAIEPRTKTAVAAGKVANGQ